MSRFRPAESDDPAVLAGICDGRNSFQEHDDASQVPSGIFQLHDEYTIDDGESSNRS
jgi:hypothetical protein